jgi:phosphate transport system permease protein
VNSPLTARKRWGALFLVLCLVATLFGIVALAILLWDVIGDGWTRLDWDFITSFPSRRASTAGIKSALVGTLWVITLTALFAFPVGVGAAVYLEEYAPDNRLTRVIEVNIANLAGIPSVIYGLLGLGVFVRWMQLQRSILAGALTLALLVLPIIIIASREALRAVPRSIREAGYALGATRWQVLRAQVLPVALPSILTGTILALSRAIGETAPLITIGALTYIAFLPEFSPEGLLSQFTVLPIQIFNWISRPQEEFHVNAAAGIIVLLVVLLALNAAAILLRNKYQQKANW